MSRLPSVDQLETMLVLVENNFSVTKTAEQMDASQPGISRRLQSLEEQLGVDLFERRGRQLIKFSDAGEEIYLKARDLVSQLADISNIAADHRHGDQGELNLVTTQTQARYALPDVVSAFVSRYPQVYVQIYQAVPESMAQMVRNSEVDLAIATESFEHFSDLLVLPCYSWRRCLLVPKDHEFAGLKKLPSAKEMSKYSILTYNFGLDGPKGVRAIFQANGCEPDLRITVTDAEAIKSYVRSGLGIGLIANMALDLARDDDLSALDASSLFPVQTTSIAIRRNSRLRAYVYFFIEQFAPHLKQEIIRAADGDPEVLKGLYKNLKEVR